MTDAEGWELDHLAVAARSLEEGQAWVETRLGVRMVAGGRHAEMATWNRLLSLGPRLYLEVIAIDPEAPPAGRPRWFALDEFEGPPRVAAWVVRVPDLDAALAAAPDGMGVPLDFARDPYRWRMAVPASGRLPFDGMAPALISWRESAHPAAALPASGIGLRRLDVAHPEPLDAVLPAIGRVHHARGAATLSALFDTPVGERVL